MTVFTDVILLWIQKFWTTHSKGPLPPENKLELRSNKDTSEGMDKDRIVERELTEQH